MKKSHVFHLSILIFFGLSSFSHNQKTETIYPKFSDKVMEKNFIPIRNYTATTPHIDVIGTILFRIEGNSVYCYPYIKTATGEVASMKYTIYEAKSNEKIIGLVGDYLSADGDVIYLFNKDSTGDTGGIGDRIYKGQSFTVTYKNIKEYIGTFTIEYKSNGVIGFYHEFLDNQYKQYIGVKVEKY